MGREEAQPLLNGDTTPTYPLRRRRSSQSRRQLRSRRKGYALSILGGAAILAILYFLIGMLWRAQRRRSVRTGQTLDGFTEARLSQFFEKTPSSSLTKDQLFAHALLSNFSRPSCTLDYLQRERYKPLDPKTGKKGWGSPSPHEKPRHHLRYLIALNLHSSSEVLPSLIHTLHTVMRLMDPSRFHISIYENGSTDSTPGQLFLFSRLLDRLGAGYTITTSTTPRNNPANTRIGRLADLRNLALAPVLNAPAGTFDRVIFLNDVHICEGDLMELLLQHEVQGAHMSCGMDYQYLRIKEFKEQGYPLLFYDVWVARDMMGLPFYEIKYPTGDWVLPSTALPQSPSRSRYHSLQPFQVYSCFNGVAALDASLFETKRGLRFRSVGGTDTESECFLLCRDIWEKHSPISITGRSFNARRGAKIQVVPRASVGYQMDEYEGARQDRNTTAFEVPGSKEEEMIEWKQWPPKLVASYPFARWNEAAWVPPF